MFTTLTCDISSATLYLKLGRVRGNLEVLNQTHTWNMTPFPPCTSLCWIHWLCVWMRMFGWNIPFVLADSGVQIKLENGYHLLPQSYQGALASKPMLYFFSCICLSWVQVFFLWFISQLREPLTGKDEQSSGIRANRLLLLKIQVHCMCLSHKVDFSFKLESW